MSSRPAAKAPRPCACGCGELTQGVWATGYDRKAEAAVVRRFGGVLALLRHAEEHFGEKIVVTPAGDQPR